MLERAEAYAGKKPVGKSMLDGLGMGLGFAFALTCLGTVREVLGAGTFLGLPLFGPQLRTLGAVPAAARRLHLARHLAADVSLALARAKAQAGVRRQTQQAELTAGHGGHFMNESLDPHFSRRVSDQQFRAVRVPRHVLVPGLSRQVFDRLAHGRFGDVRHHRQRHSVLSARTCCWSASMPSTCASSFTSSSSRRRCS